MAAIQPKAMKDANTGEVSRLILPAGEGVYEFEGYVVLVEFNGKVEEPAPKAVEPVVEPEAPPQAKPPADPESEAEGFIPADRRTFPKFLGYVPVKLASFGRMRVTPKLHAAPAYKDGNGNRTKVDYALCNRTENRKTHHQKDREISEVNCHRCQGHLREMGWTIFDVEE